MLSPGTRLGAYEIGALLGAGGMGEVYRARDLRIGRDVAVKILPRAVADDADRLARFEREARVLGSISHPHIAAIYGVEESADIRALILELVEGPTLSERLSRGALAIDEAIAIGRQIADALEAAHEKGIVHRDLKPANIKVTREGMVKVLDFGIAKAMEDVSGERAETVVDGPIATGAGVVLGTPGYMSPEQARGRPVDKRTDIWAFGCVLYEMLSGRVAFSGATASDTIAAILGRDPDWAMLPEWTPDHLRRLLRRCLEKDARQRLRDIGDARLELAAGPTPAADRSRERRLPWRVAALASLIVLVAIAVAAWGWLRPAPGESADLVRMTVTLPPGISVTAGPGYASSLALSPDGRMLIIAGTGDNGQQQLYRRRLDELEATPLPGSSGGTSPFFSPDGQWIGFFAEGRLRRIPAAGGAAVDVTEVPEHTFGATWGPDDRIVLVWGFRSPLHAVDARGGVAEAITTIENDEAGHYRPELLPDGRTLLFDDGRWIVALDRASGRRVRLLQGVAPRYAATGHVIFARGNTLLGTPFDPSRLETTGAVVPLVEGVADALGVGTRHYVISRAGALAYLPAATSHALVIVKADGGQSLIEQRPAFENPQFSPDGQRIAVASRRRAGEEMEIWLYDLARPAPSRLTFNGGRAPVWTPDGTEVTYSHLGEEPGIYQKRVDGVGEAERRLALADFHWLVGWTPDGRTLAFGGMERARDAGTSPSTIFAFAGGETRRVVGPGTVWGGRLSPDGRWLAYYWLEAGSYEVYVTPFPGGDTRWQVSEDGGRDPSWGPDGAELYYRSGDRLIAARLDMTSGARVLSRRVAIEPFRPPLYDDYDIHPDGRTVVLVRPAGDAVDRQVTLVLNWFTDLQHLIPRR